MTAPKGQEGRPSKVLTLAQAQALSTSTTETVYRLELRPVISTGAEVMDNVFKLG